MSKPIINGIDVSECEFYFEDNGVIAPDGTPERANICTSPEKSCENNDSCYCNKDCYFKQLKRLQEENEKLKKELEIALKEEARWKSNFNNYKYTIREQHTLIKQYEQALKEIKNEIGDLKNINRLINLQKILDIINEALNDN